jgi:hypothetical protein
VCETGAPPAGDLRAEDHDLDKEDLEGEHCTSRKTENDCFTEQTAGEKVKCTWCGSNRWMAKCRKNVRMFACSGAKKCPGTKKYNEVTKMCK